MPKTLLQFPANRFDLGVNLQASRNLQLGELAEAISIRFERGSGVFTGPGYREVEDLATSAAVDALLGATVFKALWIKSGTKVFYMPDPDSGTSYDSGLTVTTATKSWFQQQGNGDMHFFNQTDTPVRIAIARNTAALTSASTEITVGADYIGKFSGVNPSTVRINDDAITYTGKNATQLTGVTGIQAAGHAANQMVIQTSNPSTWVEEKGTFSFELEGRFCIGGQVNKENILSASAPEDEDNPAFFYDFDANGEVKRIFPLSLTGGIAALGRAFVFGERAVHQILGFDVATGAFLTNPISTLHGAYNPRCVVDMDGIACFMGNKRVMPIVLKLGPDAAVPSFDEAFDHKLRPWLDELDPFDDQDEAFLSYDPVQKILKVGASRNGSVEVRVIDVQGAAPAGYESRPGSSWAFFDGKMYFGNTVGKIFRDDIGLTNDGATITHKWKTGRMETEEGRRPIQLHKLEYDGFMSEACEHTLRVYMDGSSTAAYSVTFDDSLITTLSGTPLGNRGIGVSTIAGSTGVNVYPFKNNIILRGIEGEDVQVEWEVSTPGAYFQVNSMNLTAYAIRRSQRTYN